MILVETQDWQVFFVISFHAVKAQCKSEGGRVSTTLNSQAPVTERESSSTEQKPPFPGIPTTSDGAGMVVWVETHITQGAGAYPITSSPTMGGGYPAEVANATRNLLRAAFPFLPPHH